MADTVLDLSSKSHTSLDLRGFSSHRRLSVESYASSPTTPPRHPSFSDDDSDSASLPTGSAPGSAIKPIAGPIPSASSPILKSSRDRDDSSSPTTPSYSSGGGSRPFKSYPMDSMASMFSPSSHLLNSSAALPPGLNGAMGLSSLYDSAASFPSFPITPLTSHLLQRKRRAESRASQEVTSDSLDIDCKKLKHVPEEKKDTSYWERRRKNNDAAKRSRDNRRCKEEEIAMRAAFLEQENLKLRAQVAILKNETAKLHYMLYNRL